MTQDIRIALGIVTVVIIWFTAGFYAGRVKCDLKPREQTSEDEWNEWFHSLCAKIKRNILILLGFLWLLVPVASPISRPGLISSCIVLTIVVAVFLTLTLHNGKR